MGITDRIPFSTPGEFVERHGRLFTILRNPSGENVFRGFHVAIPVIDRHEDGLLLRDNKHIFPFCRGCGDHKIADQSVRRRKQGNRALYPHRHHLLFLFFQHKENSRSRGWKRSAGEASHKAIRKKIANGHK